MSRLKLTALRLGFQVGLFRLVQHAVRRRQGVILTFHRFSGNGDGDPRGMPIQRFAESLAYLTRQYRVVSLGTMTDELRRGVVRPYTVAVTVDDGYHEVFTLAAPILRQYGVPASLFVISDFIDGRLWPWTDRWGFVFERAPRDRVAFRYRGSTYVLEMREDADRQRAETRWLEYAKRVPVADRDGLLEAIAGAAGVRIPVAPPSQYRPMTWGQLRTLAAEGFDVGAHTRTHPILAGVDPQQLRAEVEGCKEKLEQHLGVRVRHFAYPNGRREDYTPEAVEAVARAGYLAAVTTIPGGNTPSTPPFELRRIGARPEDLAHFVQSVSGFDEIRIRARLGFSRTPAPSGPGGALAPAMESE
jgi:peptidoglycan/xylan/chitin deacetylase (PgdA/CDA1 family)